jgi:hypothetical protein
VLVTLAARVFTPEAERAEVTLILFFMAEIFNPVALIRNAVLWETRDLSRLPPR